MGEKERRPGGWPGRCAAIAVLSRAAASLRPPDGRGLPLVVDDVVAGVYGEDAGFVDVVLGVGVVGADADLLCGGEVVDGDGFAGAGVGAGEEGHCAAGGIFGGEAGEGWDPGGRKGRRGDPNISSRSLREQGFRNQVRKDGPYFGRC